MPEMNLPTMFLGLIAVIVGLSIADYIKCGNWQGCNKVEQPNVTVQPKQE